VANRPLPCYYGQRMVSIRSLPLLILLSVLLLQCGTTPPPPETADPVLIAPGNSGDDSGEIPAAAPRVERPSPPDEGELLRFALTELSGELRPVLDRRGEPVSALLREDERIHLVVLCTAGDESFRYDALGNLSRLYNQDSRLFFTLVDIQWFDGRTFLAYSEDLGEFPVLESFEASEFGASEAPLAVTVQFQSGDGGEEFILFFGPRKAAVLQLKQNSTSFARRRDLDGDGIDDIILFDAVYEEGTGKETFLTWYRWDGSGLSVYRSTNIVRNLNIFLEQSRRVLEQGRFGEFLERFLPAGVPVESLKAEPFETSFHRIFTPDEGPGSRALLDEESFQAVTRVAFPEILENPFDIAAGDYGIELPVHFIGERDYRYRINVVMDTNPFEGRQFHFLQDLN
jgi:hypothetical protein